MMVSKPSAIKSPRWPRSRPSASIQAWRIGWAKSQETAIIVATSYFREDTMGQHWRMALFAAATAAAAWSAPARADYPDKQITMVVCFPAGGGTDIAARLVNTQLGEALGKPVIVENRGGAGGNIGIAAAARAGGDGYTLLVCSSAYVVNPSLYAQATYDPYKDFVPVMVIGASPNAFVVPAQSDIKIMPELIAKP